MPASSQRSTSPPTRRAAAFGLAAAPLAGALATCGPAAAKPYDALAGGTTWLNGPPLRASDLRGKVVLVNFWTYTCINSLRPLPYLRAWADKYRDRGLGVVGVHAPEFSFEHEFPRVREAVAELDVRYPVVLDNDFRIWRAFRNGAWPGFYFLDGRGTIRHQHMGEGDYPRSERVLQALLAEASGRQITDPIAPVVGLGSQAAPDWDDLESPETYLGYAKAETFANRGGLHQDLTSAYTAPGHLARNSWSLAGDWTVRSEFAELVGSAGAVAYRFHARDLHLVMSSAGDRPLRFRVRLEGADPGADHGADVDARGWGELVEARMYQLVRQTGPVEDRTFEIEFQGPGARAYCFTFG